MRSFNLSLNRYIVGMLLIVLMLLIYLQIQVNESTRALKHGELEKSKIYASNIADLIIKKTDGNISGKLRSDKTLRMQLNEILETFHTPQYEYIFVLGRDHHDHYRFLLDGSKEDKEDFGTIFMPQSSKYDLAYQSRKPQIARQKDAVKGVWISLLYPIVIENKTQALLVLDLSREYGERLESFNSPLMYVIRLMQLLFIVMLIFLLLMMYRYHKLRKETMVDRLTGAHTKLYLEEYFNRYDVGMYYALLIDIDEFKDINRAYGYDTGDMILRTFVDEVRIHMPEKAHVIRVGGAEFFLFVEKGEHSLERIAGQLLEALREKRYLVDNDVVKMTVSISAIDTPSNTVRVQHVLHVLDEALLKIKSRGKNDLVILDAAHRLRLKYQHIDYIKQALEEERLVCLYQPIYSTEDQTVHKYETLVRLIDRDDPSLLISPAEFLSVIRGTSQYIKMSKLVLQKVFERLEHYPHIHLSVNLDLNDLYNRDMMQMISDFLYRHQESAHRLTFEILETEEIDDYARVNFIFMQLREYGSKIVIDDFGSGYSNYDYLIKLNIDMLKIDGSLIRELEKNTERARTVISSIVSISQSLGYEVVAEFVATEKIWEEVVSLGITYAQGYYLGKPDHFETYITEVNNGLTDD